MNNLTTKDMVIVAEILATLKNCVNLLQEIVRRVDIQK